MPNPSHLEFVNPVVTGRVRALQTDHTRSEMPRDLDRAMAIQIHGDAAFPGQGIVAETLNLAALEGYTVGGSLHIIANNQVGFTTDPIDSRSTGYSSDLAKGFDMPIVHVNADDIDACRTAVRLATAYRRQFGHDVMIDLVGYRRWGHNEGDEPAYTQALMYDRIKSHPTMPTLYGERLVEEGVLSESEVAEIRSRVTGTIAGAHETARSGRGEPRRQGGQPRATADQESTGVPAEALRQMQDELLTFPNGFTPHPKLHHAAGAAPDRARRAAASTGRQAESLALGSLLADARPGAHDRPGHRARHLLAPPPRPARRRQRRHVRADPAPLDARAPPSRCTTRRSPRRRAWASSTATRSPRRTRS